MSKGSITPAGLLPANQRLQQLANLWNRAKSLNATEDELFALLALDKKTFRYVQRAARFPLGDVAPPDYQKRIEAAAKYVSVQVLNRIAAMCDILEQGLGGAQSCKFYESAVAAEIDALGDPTVPRQPGAKGDQYVVITATPLLESKYADVRKAVLRAAKRGVKFRYYYPSETTVALAKLVFYQEQKATSAGAPNLHSVLWWLKGPDVGIRHVQQLLAADAAGLDSKEGADDYSRALESNVSFRPMVWLILSINEKIAYIRKNGEETVRKEMLLPSLAERRDADYDDIDRWIRVKYPVDPEVLEKLIEHCSPESSEAENEFYVRFRKQCKV